LDGEPLVLRSACELKEGGLRETGLSMRIAAKVERDDLALRLVAQGIGIAIAPRSLATADIVALPVADLGLDRSIGLKWRPDLPQETVATVLDTLSSLRPATGGAAL
jgi:DNA-binding transcriptional LysR family regulator